MRWVAAIAAVDEVTDVRPLEPGRVVVVFDGRPVELDVRYHRRPPRPNELEKLPRDDGPCLYVAPRLTEGVRRRLEEAGWSWADDVAAAVRAPDGQWLRTSAVWEQQRRLVLRWRDLEPARFTGSGAARADLDVVRVLVTEPRPRWTQADLARRVGVTQPAVSQALQRLEANGPIDATGELVDRSSAIDWWLEHYWLPTEAVETHWYGLQDPWATTGALHAASGDAAVVVSGAAAADVLAPWLPPDRLIVYAPRGDWLPASLTRVDELTDAVVTVVVVDPVHVDWHHPRADQARAPDGSRLHLAHPLQILWDLQRTPSDDPARRDEAAARLRTWLVDDVASARP